MFLKNMFIFSRLSFPTYKPNKVKLLAELVFLQLPNKTPSLVISAPLSPNK